MNHNLNNIYFGIINGCNLKCSYCYVPKEKKFSNNDIYESFKSFVLKLHHENYTFNHCYFHGVEPSMVDGETYRKMLDFYYLYFPLNEHKNIHFNFKTNGINISSILEHIKPNEMNIGFSIDGIETINDYFRGKGTFKKSYNNMLLAKSKGFNVGIVCVLSQKSYEKEEDFEKLIEFSKLIEQMNISFHIKTIYTDDEKLTLHNKIGYNLGKDIFYSGLSKDIHYLNRYLCSAAGNDCTWYQFNHDGNTYTCNKGYSKDKKIGNWNIDSFDSIIKNRKDIYKNEYINEECYQCEYFNLCNGGCPLDRINGKNLTCFLKKGTLDAAKEFGITNLIDIFNNKR